MVEDLAERSFLRPYGTPDPALLQSKLRALQSTGWLDRIITAPLDGTAAVQVTTLYGRDMTSEMQHIAIVLQCTLILDCIVSNL